MTYIREMPSNDMGPPALSALTSKILGCLHQLEQVLGKEQSLVDFSTAGFFCDVCLCLYDDLLPICTCLFVYNLKMQNSRGNLIADLFHMSGSTS